MVDLLRTRKRKILREAEGYLDLITVFADQWPPSPPVRDRLARRAIKVLDRLQGEELQQAQAWYLKGQALRVMERYSEAIHALATSAELEPENLHVWLALGWCHKRCDRLDLAIQSLEEALGVDSSQAIVHYNLACYWSLAGKEKLALRYLSQAFEIDSSFRELVSEESDFDPIRSHPLFQAMTTVIV